VPKPFDFGGVNLTAGEESGMASPTAETPFCVAILGDFSGRKNRKISDPGSIAQRRAILIDRDNFDEVLSRLHPELNLSLGEGGSLRLRFSELDDFHPDRIFENLEAFATLRGLRTRLEDPSSFKAAAEELGLRASPAPAATPKDQPIETRRAPSAVALASGSLLDDMIEQTESRVSEQSARRASDPVREFAQRVAAQHLVSAPDPRQPEILAVMDRTIGALMRAVLHNPDFQALEAVWRAVFLLVRQIDTSSQLKLYVIDISKGELVADLSTAKDVRDSGAYRLLVEKSVGTAGADPWSVLVGAFSFDGQDDDAIVLARMGAIADRAGAPFLAEGSPHLLGCAALAAAPHPRDWRESQEQSRWPELRRLPVAKSIGLALPRFVLRLPYGKKTSSLESFDFEEFTESAGHEDYLWGNPAFVLALLLAQSFSGSGWEMRVGDVAELSGLPLHISRKDGNPEMKPCAEVLLTEDAVEQIVNSGLMSLVSFKNRDAVRVARFQSIADPPAALAGRWI